MPSADMATAAAHLKQAFECVARELVRLGPHRDRRLESMAERLYELHRDLELTNRETSPPEPRRAG